MSSCAAKFACAIAEPFSERARGSCVPLYPAPDSHKVTATMRFDGAIGTQGVGFIAFNPSLARNMPSASYSNALYADSVVKVLSAATALNTGVAWGYHNGPYSAQELLKDTTSNETELQGRVVSFAGRLTYTGTTLNQSGLVTALQHPNHGNLSGAATSDLQAFQDVDICAFTRKPCELSVVPSTPNEIGYIPTIMSSTRMLYPFGGSDNQFHTTFDGAGFSYGISVDTFTSYVAAPVAVIIVTGVPGSTFHVDAVAHLEYTGSGCASASTPNSVDVSSVYAILTGASQLGNRKMAEPTASSWKLLMDGVRAAMGSPVVVGARGVISGSLGL